jgi:hypothetical protein
MGLTPRPLGRDDNKAVCRVLLLRLARGDTSVSHITRAQGPDQLQERERGGVCDFSLYVCHRVRLQAILTRIIASLRRPSGESHLWDNFRRTS